MTATAIDRDTECRYCGFPRHAHWGTRPIVAGRCPGFKAVEIKAPDAERPGDPWHALECAQFWLQEERDSERPGQTKPDDILRVIGDALAGRPTAPLTSDLVKPDLASQLRFLASVIGTDSQQGRNEARQTVAYVEGVAARLLASLKDMTALAEEAISARENSEDDEDAECAPSFRADHDKALAAIAAAEGREG